MLVCLRNPPHRALHLASVPVMGQRWCAAAAGILVAGGVLLSPGVAAGQAPEAVITVDQVHPAGSSVHYYVRITSEATGEPINGATVSATATSPDGAPGPTVGFTPADDDGRYQGPVSMPDEGTWTIVFASNNPDASLRYPQEVPATTQEDFAPTEEDEGISNPIVLVLGGVFLVLLAAIGAWAVVAGRKPTDAADGEASAEPEASVAATTTEEPAPTDESGRKPGRTW